MGCSKSPNVQPDYPCLEDPYDDDEDFEIMRRRRRRKKKPSYPKTPCRSYSPKPPDDPNSSQLLPIYKKALKWIEKENRIAILQEPIPSSSMLKSCLISSSQSYQESFPPLEKKKIHTQKLFPSLLYNHP